MTIVDALAHEERVSLSLAVQASRYDPEDKAGATTWHVLVGQAMAAARRAEWLALLLEQEAGR
jgi:hypothetical protein